MSNADKLSTADRWITEHLTDDGSVRTWRSEAAPTELWAVFAGETFRGPFVVCAVPPSWRGLSPMLALDGEFPLVNGWSVGVAAR